MRVSRLGILFLTLTRLMVSQDAGKLWSVDLAKDHDFLNRSRSSVAILRPPSLDFLNDDQIIVAFDDNAMSVPSPNLTPFGFHVLEVAATSGSVGRKLSFQVLVNSSQAEATNDGNFLVLAGEELKKYSSSFKEVASFPTLLMLHGQPTDQHIGERHFLNPHFERWRMDVAPGGGEVVLAHVKDPWKMELSWLRTSDFSTIATLQAAPVEQQGMSAANKAVWLLPFGGGRLLLSSGQEVNLCDHCFKVYFLTEDLLFLDERDKYEIKTMSGEAKAKGKLRTGISQFYRAAHASRFAYATGHYKGSGFPLQTHFAPHMQVKVFDWSTMKQVSEVSFDRPEQPENSVSTGFRDSAIALSPDGQRLLVLTGSILSLYKLK